MFCLRTLELMHVHNSNYSKTIIKQNQLFKHVSNPVHLCHPLIKFQQLLKF